MKQKATFWCPFKWLVEVTSTNVNLENLNNVSPDNNCKIDVLISIFTAFVENYSWLETCKINFTDIIIIGKCWNIDEVYNIPGYDILTVMETLIKMTEQ